MDALLSDFGPCGSSVADNTPVLQAAIDAVAGRYGHGGEGGRLRVPPGTYRCQQPLSLQSRYDLTIEGYGEIVYEGLLEPFVSLASAQRITLRDLRLSYSHPGFQGRLVACDTTGSDPAYLWFDNVVLSGRPTATGAIALLELNRAIMVDVARCRFSHAQVGIAGVRDSYSNNVAIRAGTTFAQLDRVAVLNAGESWTVQGCTFQQLRSGQAGAYTQTPTYYARALTFDTCWFGDVSANGGSWISPVLVLGLQLRNNSFGTPGAGPTDVCVRVQGSQAVTILGNRFEGPRNLSFEGSYTFGGLIAANDFQGGIPILGTNLTQVRRVGNLGLADA